MLRRRRRVLWRRSVLRRRRVLWWSRVLRRIHALLRRRSVLRGHILSRRCALTRSIILSRRIVLARIHALSRSIILSRRIVLARIHALSRSIVLSGSIVLTGIHALTRSIILSGSIVLTRIHALSRSIVLAGSRVLPRSVLPGTRVARATRPAKSGTVHRSAAHSRGRRRCRFRVNVIVAGQISVVHRTVHDFAIHRDVSIIIVYVSGVVHLHHSSTSSDPSAVPSWMPSASAPSVIENAVTPVEVVDQPRADGKTRAERHKSHAAAEINHPGIVGRNE